MKKMVWFTAIITSVLPLTILSLLFFNELKSLSEVQIQETIHREAEIGMQTLSEFLEERFGNLEEWSRGTPLKIAFEFQRPEGLRETLTFLKQQYPFYDSISVLDEHLKLFASTSRENDFVFPQWLPQMTEANRSLFLFAPNKTLYLVKVIENPFPLNAKGYLLATLAPKKINELIKQAQDHLKMIHVHEAEVTFEPGNFNPLSHRQVCSQNTNSRGRLAVCITVPISEFLQGFYRIRWVLILTAIFLILITFASWTRFTKKFTQPMNQLLYSLGGFVQGHFRPVNFSSQVPEIQSVELKFNQLLDELNLAREKLTLQTREQALYEISLQVAHDIRSPLSVLTLLETQIQDWPEDKRILMREASRRITDIANELIHQHKKMRPKEEESHSNRNLVLITPLIDSIISEKRIQYRNNLSLQIEAELEDSYGAFAILNFSEIQRVLSNLINNSAEALGAKGGKIIIGTRTSQKSFKIFIFDNGPGLPQAVLERVGEKGLSFGKNQSHAGTGLGLYHAKKIIDSHKGQLLIDSRPNQGTRIELIFEKSQCPKWFLSELILKAGAPVLICDDDKSIHLIWKERLAESILVNCSNEVGFKEIFSDTLKNNPDLIFLIDYEFLGHKTNGLDLIELFRIESRSILVTSRYMDVQVQVRCECLGIRMIPKTMVGYVPISYV